MAREGMLPGKKEENMRIVETATAGFVAIAAQILVIATIMI